MSDIGEDSLDFHLAFLNDGWRNQKAWKAKADKKCGLVFPTAGCNPKLDFLDCLEACTERATLDKENFWLHKFRATFATRCLWAGVDLRTVQQWLDHSDMESTMDSLGYY